MSYRICTVGPGERDSQKAEQNLEGVHQRTVGGVQLVCKMYNRRVL